MTVWVQRPPLQFGPGLSGATDLKALLSQTRVAKPPEAGPNGPTRLAAAHCPWYLCLLVSALAALKESPLNLTSWRMMTSVPELRTPASMPVDQDVTLAVTRVRVSVFGLVAARGNWGPSPGNPSVASKPPTRCVWIGLHRRQGRARWGVPPLVTPGAQSGSHPPCPAGWSAAKARARPGDSPAPLAPAARVATVRVAKARAGHQALAASGLRGFAGPL